MMTLASTNLEQKQFSMGYIRFLRKKRTLLLFWSMVFWAALHGTATAQSLPDLIVTSVSWTPASPVTGNVVQFNAVVQNQGTAATPSTTVIGISWAVDGTLVNWSGQTLSLAPGSTITLAAQGGPNGTSTWATTAGNHTVVAWVDDVNRIAESNESNNKLSAALFVNSPTPPPPSGNLPDLIVSNLTWSPANPAAGTAVQFTATLKNQGTVATPSGPIITVAFQVDGTLVNWSNNLAPIIYPGAISIQSANGGPSGSNQWIVTAGTHTVTAWADDVNSITESNETNNKLDVALTAGGVTPPPAPVPAAPANLTATAGNAQVSLSWTAVSGATSYNLKRSATNGGPYTTVASPTAPSYTNTGLNNGTTYYYVVSAVNANGESANSSQASALPTAPPPPTGNLPDLIVSSLTWSPISPAIGDAVQFTATLKNQGTAATPSGTIVSVAFLVDGTVVNWSNNLAPVIAPGAISIHTANSGPSGSDRWTAAAGTHTISALADDSNSIAESNESNNRLDMSIAVGSTPPPSPAPGGGPTGSTPPPNQPAATPPSAGTAITSASTTIAAGNLQLTLSKSSNGISLTSLLDTATGTQLESSQLQLPLFTLVLGSGTQLNANGGWGSVTMASISGGYAIQWANASAAPGITVIANALVDASNNAIRWVLTVNNSSSQSVRNAIFPQLGVANLGAAGRVFLPRGPGEVQYGYWGVNTTYSELYPNGWTASLQHLAAYNGSTGIYFGMHDPTSSTKYVGAYGLPAYNAVKFVFEHVPPNTNQAGNSFTIQGQAVWQILRGDWFDAAQIYRNWAKNYTNLIPPMGVDGRTSTPLWMRELSVWTQAAGADSGTISSVQAFAQYMGIPTGFHWYTWHQIPFDNDYPHYFPPQPGFASGVTTLKNTVPRVRVMPYINGRLWDTHDSGTVDSEYTSVARPATTKDTNLAPYIENYGSLESNGAAVLFSIMCPTTTVWQNRMRDIALTLFNTYGVDGVYMDQISAAVPRFCYDTTHGHPVGGGRYWADGYRTLLGNIRSSMPTDRMLTTESATDAYNDGMDGYLTWNWQRNGMVPAFSAIYNGAVQLFGRNFSGGIPRDLSVRQRAGQQLVFGEQIGWAFPSLIYEASAPFVRQAANVRSKLARYFYAGEMGRPLALSGITAVTSDWQWQGAATPVTTDSVLTGTFIQKSANKLIVLFANISDASATVTVNFNGASYGLTGNNVSVTTINWNSTGAAFTSPIAFTRSVVVPAQTVFAWEVTATP